MTNTNPQITSTHNPQIRHLILLQQKASERRKYGQFVVEGQREIGHCINAGYEIESIFVLEGIRIPPLAAKPHIFTVSDNVYERIAYRGSTEGMVAIVKTKGYTLAELEETLLAKERKVNESPDIEKKVKAISQEKRKATFEKTPLIVVLESVEKPGNLGAILRSADAANADAVIICDPLTDLYNPNLIRASIGACFTVPLIACSSEECIRFLKNAGIQICTAQLQDSELYYNTDMKRPTAIVMGTESTGLTDIWREEANVHIRIPMLGKLDSLNVSVSAAILLFEAVRQRSYV
ncbi:MAG: RNA methyltransferase [Bacteroidaceae bacterium]|nr:RNA methyltransferase [Bacteroidaceae bacterium]